MGEKEYYLDSCIWLNLFKKEGDAEKGIPYWKLAKDFIEQVEENNGKIIVSTIVLKEIYFVAKEKFEAIREFFRRADFITIVKTAPEDYNLAREWEKKHRELSFYDYLQAAIAKRLNATLVTRDQGLISFAEDNIEASKPEDLLS